MEDSKSTPISSSMTEELDPSMTEELDQEVEHLLQTLPHEKAWLSPGVSLYQGFWFPSFVLRNVISFQKHHQAHDQDIVLVSKPKSGTTWLKALLFSIVNRTRYTPSNSPLLNSNPHDLVPFIEFHVYAKKELPDLGSIPCPRLFATHIPYASLPESIKGSNCKIVYVCRNPFDVFVSSWHFGTQAKSSNAMSIEEYFELFSKGIDAYGPFWDHVLGFWKESLEKPQKVLFLKYEDLKEDNISHLKRLAEFIGFPFSLDEERKGVIREISKLCSLTNLKELEVNKTGEFIQTFKHKSYFRKGEVGDWVNYLNPSMVESLEKVMQEKLSGTGLTFKLSS